MSTGADPAPLPGRWIMGQQAFLGAMMLLTEGRPGAVAENEALEGKVWPDAWLMASEWEAYRDWLRDMPTATLHALNRLAPCLSRDSSWRDHAGRWAEALRYQMSAAGPRQSLPRIAAAKLLADRILSGVVSSAEIVRLAWSELNVDWRGHEGALSEFLLALPSATLVTAGRLEALAQFRARVASAAPANWAMVENVILEQSFAWPSLVLHGPLRKEWSLPIEVKIKLGGTGQSLMHTPDPELIDVEGWKESLDRARTAFVELWLYKHKSWDANFISAIENADVELDLAAAAEILAGFPKLTLELVGSSLETYVALLFLGALVEPRAMETVRATGLLGDPISNKREKGHDFGVRQPVGIGLKRDLAWMSTVVEHLVLPYHPRRRLDSVGHLRVSDTATTLADMADLIFGERWRKHGHSRCPDFQFAFKKRQTEADIVDGQAVLDVLSGTSNAVVELPSETRPEAVAWALKALADKAASGGGSTPQALSYTVVRAAEGEPAEKFWQVVAEALKGPPEQMQAFLVATRLERPAAWLAEQLNPAPPNLTRPGRAPDLLVLLGARHLDAVRSLTGRGPFGRFDLAANLARLRRLLRPTDNAAVAELIGPTRILVVWEDGSPRRVAEPWPKLPSDLRQALHILSIFRFEFTREMARVLLGLSLGLPDGKFEVLFNRLLKVRIGVEPVVAQPQSEFLQRNGGREEHRATPPNLYFLTTPALPKGDPLSRADIHEIAAHAISCLTPGESVGYCFREGLQPAQIYEAQWHLRQAHLLSGRPYLRSALERLSRIGGLTGWWRVREAILEFNEDGPEILDAISQSLDTAASSDPLDMVWLAELSARLASRHKLSWRDARIRGESFFRRAEEICAALPEEMPIAAIRFCIHSSRAGFLARSDPQRPQEAAADVEEALRLQPDADEVIAQHWFESAGDIVSDHNAAIGRYRGGLLNTRIAGAAGLQTSLLVRYLGACSLSGAQPDVEIVSAARAAERSIGRDIGKGKERRGGYPRLRHVQARLDAGRRSLKRLSASKVRKERHP